MDEIKQLAKALEAAIKEQRAIRGRIDNHQDDELDDQVQAICGDLLDASGVDGFGGCELCKN